MAKTNRKESRKIYEGYKNAKDWNTIFIVFFAVIGIGSAVLNGTMELDPQIVIGKYEFTWFHLVILAVLVVLLGFGIVALKRDSSEEQQEFTARSARKPSVCGRRSWPSASRRCRMPTMP